MNERNDVENLLFCIKVHIIAFQTLINVNCSVFSPFSPTFSGYSLKSTSQISELIKSYFSRINTQMIQYNYEVA